MKYSDQNPPLVCMMTQSTCYQGTSKGTPVGVLWHDTAGGNPNLSRYVQPDDNAPNKAELIAILGKNKYNNDFNHINRSAGLNCWVGKLADGSMATVQTMPWDYRPWGCGGGSKGSCNGITGGPFWIQFEICDDGYTSGTEEYFRKAYKEACEITAYLCKKFNIDPKGTVNYKGVIVPTILCHYDSYKLGLGSGHSDIYTWFSKFNVNMEDARNDVAKLLQPAAETPAPQPTPEPQPQPTPSVTLAVGDLVAIKEGATYYTGKSVPSWVSSNKFYIRSIKDDRVILGKSEDSKLDINSAFKISNLIKIEIPQEFQPYIVRITASALNVRSGPSTAFEVKLIVYKGSVYTIVEEQNGWGKLKSGAGWINLSYTEKK